MKTAYVEAVAVIGPGLDDWHRAASVLRDPAAYMPGPVSLDNAGGMTANERRRTTPVIRLVLQVLEQLSAQSSLDLSSAMAIFATSWGDMKVVDTMLCTLPMPGSPVSPVHFHYSAHNTPAGYWSIGTGARGLSTSLTAADATVAAGLLESFVCLGDDDAPLLLVCYDHSLPAAWDQFYHIEGPFAAAMTLTSRRTEQSRCAMTLRLLPEQPETRMAHPALERLRLGNPAARTLPILQAMGMHAPCRVVLPSTIGRSSLAIDIEPLCQPVHEDGSDPSERIAAAIAAADAA